VRRITIFEGSPITINEGGGDDFFCTISDGNLITINGGIIFLSILFFIPSFNVQIAEYLNPIRLGAVKGKRVFITLFDGRLIKLSEVTYLSYRIFSLIRQLLPAMVGFQSF
jgi:hypothetical protein